MDTETLPPNVAYILERYYTKSFGGADNWATIQSVRLDGILHLPQGQVRFIAFKKKPNLCKVVILADGSPQMILAYDGEDAWQLRLGDGPVDMPESEALNFIRDAEIGGNLMYPQYPGKQIERLPGRTVEGASCVVLRVTRPDGQQVECALDLASYAERQAMVTNAQSGAIEVTTYSDFRRVDGLNLPFRSITMVGGVPIREVELLSVRTNTGTLPWMFRRSAAIYMPALKALRIADRPVQSLELDFPGEADAIDFVLPVLSEVERLELSGELD